MTWHIEKNDLVNTDFLIIFNLTRVGGQGETFLREGEKKANRDKNNSKIKK